MANKNNVPDRVYHESYVVESPIPQKYKQRFANILDKDYSGKRFGFTQRVLDTTCIDMDSIENDITGNNDNTMDMVIGIAKLDVSRRTFSDGRFLPVELKLGCKSFDEISKTDLLAKNQHTRVLLNGYSVSIDSHSVFLFTENVAPTAKSTKSRWDKMPNSSNIKYWEMMSPQEYNSYIQFEKDYPYTPITDINNLKEGIANMFSKGDIDGVIHIVEYYKSKAERYRLKYNLSECNAIAEALNDSINSLLGVNKDSDVDEYLLILDEEINALM
jgi:hypothetical protein